VRSTQSRRIRRPLSGQVVLTRTLACQRLNHFKAKPVLRRYWICWTISQAINVPRILVTVALSIRAWEISVRHFRMMGPFEKRAIFNCAFYARTLRHAEMVCFVVDGTHYAHTISIS